MNDNAKIDASDDKEPNNSDDPPSHHDTAQPNMYTREEYAGHAS